jgi:PAS domain S-box-containing protein
MNAMSAGEDEKRANQGAGLNLEEVAESLADAFFLVDRFGTLVYVGPVLAEIAGTTAEKILGRNLSDLLPQDKLYHFAIIRERLMSGEAFQVEWEFPGDKGSPVFMRVYIAPWRRGGEVLGAVGIALDMTDEILRERGLEKQALLLRLQMDVLESLAKAEGITDILRVIVDKACEALGMEAGCLAALYRSERGWLARQIIQTGWPLTEARVAQWRELPGREVAQAMEEMETFFLVEGEGPLEWLGSFDFKPALVTPILSSPRGAFVLIMASSVLQESRELEKDFLRGLVSIAAQAMQRAELIGSLRQSEESYINLVDSVGEGIVILESEKVIFANRAMARLMGFSTPAELVGSSLEDIMLPESLEELRVSAGERNLAPARMRLRLRRRRDQEFVTEAEIIHLPFGARRAYQLMVKDVEGFTNDEFLSQFDFMSRLSHDLRTPLASVNGFAGVLDKLIGTDRTLKVGECLEGIKRGVARLNRMVENMLTLARTQAASEEGGASPSQVLQDVLEDLREDIRGGAVEMVVPENLPHVPVPESELQEIFQNLLSNAVRAVHGVEKPRVAVGYEVSGDHHLFTVEDNGVGIPVEHQESIFRPLFRLVSGEEGSGLGLSIVRQILRTRGGDIWVKSFPGRGTTFYFTVPAR